jgi:hypothetical protein
LCYTYLVLKHSKNTPICFTCGSPLIFVSESTELKEGSRFPQTSTKYRCSNQACQDEKDKQTAKRLKVLKEKEVNDQKRLEKKKLDKINNN